MVIEFVNINLQIKFNNFFIFNNWLNSNVNKVLQMKFNNFVIRARAYYLLCTECKQSFTEFFKKKLSTFNFKF